MLFDRLLYQSPGVQSVNSIAARSNIFSFDCEETALRSAGTTFHGERTHSLNGKWFFKQGRLFFLRRSVAVPQRHIHKGIGAFVLLRLRRLRLGHVCGTTVELLTRLFGRLLQKKAEENPSNHRNNQSNQKTFLLFHQYY